MQQAAMTVERKQAKTVAETPIAARGRDESMAEVAHDARNMVAALDLYCDLLDHPGVLGSTFAHYASELRLVAAASRKLVEKMVTLEGAVPRQLSFWRNGDWKRPNRNIDRINDRSNDRDVDWRNRDRTGGERSLEPAKSRAVAHVRFCEQLPSQPVASLAAELHATRNLLAALAGPSIAVAVDIEGGAIPVRIAAEDLTRALVNLVKNAVEAMPGGGELRISLRETAEDEIRRVTLAVEDSGPGIPCEALELIFAAGYSAHPVRLSQARNQIASQAAVAPHRGLGLAITRSIVETAGGRIFAGNRAQGGARIVMELPAAEEQGSGAREQGLKPPVDCPATPEN